MKLLLKCVLLSLLSASVWAKVSLPPIVGGKVPQSVDELWAGYDPRAEALDVKVIHEWDETYEGKALKVQMLTFAVGTFKGTTSQDFRLLRLSGGFRKREGPRAGAGAWRRPARG